MIKKKPTQNNQRLCIKIIVKIHIFRNLHQFWKNIQSYFRVHKCKYACTCVSVVLNNIQIEEILKKLAPSLQDLFQSVDRIHSGKISLESLQEVLSAALETDLSADDTNWNKILETVDPVSALYDHLKSRSSGT